MIEFVIPTWNRAEKLRRCVESIAKNNPDAIFISDDCSDDDTPKVCVELARKYRFIRHSRNPERLGFAGNYKRAIQASESEFTWTVGDDDQLTEGCVSHVLQVLRTTPLDFMHVAEVPRVGKGEAVYGTVWQICNAIGWVDFTGFISGNIARTHKLKQAVNSQNWELFGTSSYPQSLAILETMGESQAMLLETGCVVGGDFDASTNERWVKDNVGWKYLYVGDGLRKLVEDKVIPDKVEEIFFRYLEETLFGRAMKNFISVSLTAPKFIKESDWDCIKFMASMVKGDRGPVIQAWVDTVYAFVQRVKPDFIAAAESYEKLHAVAGEIKMPVYPFPYLPQEEEKNGVVKEALRT